MAYQPKSYRKFVATTATAAMVASAVVPVVSAAGFTDVAPQYKDAIDFLVSTGATNGKTETQFGVYDEITRLDAAVILAKVLKLDVDNAKDAGFTDVPKDRAKYVNALVEAGVLNGKAPGKFGAYDKLTRVEMAKIIANAYNLKGDDVELPFTDVNDTWAPYVKALYKYEVTKGKTETSFGAYQNITRGDFAQFVYRAANINVAPQVVSVSAITTNSVKVVFNKEIEGLTVDDVTVTNKGTGQKQYVKSVTLSADKKSATVEFYDKLANNNTYSFEIKSGDNTLTYDFGYVVTDVAKIEIANQTVKQGDKISFKVYDANGIDITNDVAANLQFVSPSGLIAADGTVNLTPGTSTTVKVVYTNPTTNLKVESDTVTVSVVAPEVADISKYTVASSAPTWDASDYKHNHTIASDVTNNNLYVQLVDQFGDVYSLADNATYKEVIRYESLNTDVVVVDKNTGAITPMGEGTAPVKVSVVRVNKADGKETVLLSKTVEVSVIAPAKPAVLSLDKSSITLSTKDTIGVTVTGKLVDQYGNPVANQAITVSDDIDGTDNPNIDDAGFSSVTTDSNGVFSFTVLPKADGTSQAGTYTINASVTVDGKVINTPLNVELKAPGSFYGYQVRGLVDTLDKKDGATNGSMDISVVSVDNAGLVIEEETTGVTVEVKDKDGNDITSTAVSGTKVDSAALNAGETYTVIVKLGSKVIKSQTFNVVDTTEKSVVKFTSSILDIDTSANEDLFTELAKILDVKYGTVAQNEVVIGVSFVSADDSVVNDNDNSVNPGTTTIFVKSVTFDRDGDGPAMEETVQFATPVKLTVQVK